MNFPYFMARRLYRGLEGISETGKKASVPAIHIATAGVALGLAVMIISISVVQGFKQEISRKVTGFAAHMEVMDVNTLYIPDASPVYAGKDFLSWLERQPDVKHVQRTSEKIGILKTNEDFQGITLKGAGEEYDQAFIREHLVAGKLPKFSGKKSANQIVLSQYQADNLRLKVGDRVYAYFFDRTVKTRRFEVAAIYQTNLKQFDKTFALADLRTVNKLNGWPDSVASKAEVFVRDYSRLEASAEALSANLGKSKFVRNGGPSVVTVKEHYPQVFSWLGLLDMNVWIILGLMACVAGFTMMSGLFILILEHTSTIGILRAMGATGASVRRCFLWLAAIIAVRGLVWGNLIGLSLIWVQERWGVVHLDPATYYVDVAPVSISPIIVLLLNVGTLALTLLALVGPSFAASRVQPAKAIRFE